MTEDLNAAGYEQEARLISDQQEQARSQDQHLRRLFTDFDTFGGLWDNERMKPIMANALDPEQDKAAMAGLSYVSALTGKPEREIARDYPLLRDQIAKQEFGKETVTDRQFYDLVAGKFENQRVREANLSELDSILIEDALSGSGMTRAEALSRWSNESEWGMAGTEDLDESQLMEMVAARKSEIESAIGPYAENARLVFDVLNRWTKPEEGEQSLGPEAVELLAQTLTRIPPDDRQRIYGLVGEWAGSRTEKKDWLYQVAESIGRGATNIASQKDRTKRDRDLAGEIKALEAGTATIGEDGRVITDWEPFELATGGATIPGRPLEEGEAESLIAERKQVREQLRVERELRDLAGSTVDPYYVRNKGLIGMVEKGTYMFGESASYTALAAVPVVGTALVYDALFASEYERQLARNPDMDSDNAALLATVTAAPMAAIERLQIKALTGRLPLTGAVFKRLSNPNLPLAARIGIAGAGQIVEQNLQEAAQDFVPVIIDQIGSAVIDDMGDVDFAQALEDYAGQRVETFFALLPMVMIGGGVASWREVKRGQQLTRDRQQLMRAGYSPDQIDRITAETDPDARQAVAVDEFHDRTEENIKKGAAMVQADLENAGMPTGTDVTVRQSVDATTGEVRNEYVVMGRDGNEVVTSDIDAAIMTVADIEGAGQQSAQRETANYAKALQSANAEMRGFLEDVNKSRGLDNVTFEETGSQTAQQYVDALPEADQPAAITKLRERIELQAKADSRIDLTAPLSSFVIAGTSDAEFRDGVFYAVNRVARDADPLDYVEEHVETEIKRRVGGGEVTMEWLRQQVQDYEAASGESLLTDSEQSVIEAVSTMARAYLAGNLKNEQVPTGLRSFFKQAVEYFKDVFRRAARIKKAIRDGALSEDFTNFLAESVGISESSRIEAIADSELATTFSIRQRDAMPEDNRAANNEDGQPSPGGRVAEVMSYESAFKKLEAARGRGRPTPKLIAKSKIPAKEYFSAPESRAPSGGATFSIKPADYQAKLEAALTNLDRNPEVRRDRVEMAKRKLRDIRTRHKQPGKIPAKEMAGRVQQAKAEHDQEIATLRQAEADAIAGESDARKVNAIKLGYMSRERAAASRLEQKLAELSGTATRQDDIVRSMGELEAALRILPPEARSRVGGYRKMATFKSDKGRIHFLLDRLQRVDREFERWLKDHYRGKIDKLIKRTRPKVGDDRVAKSSLGDSAQRAADWAYNASLLNDTETAQALDDIDAILKAGAITPERQAALVEQWSITNMFGDLKNRSAEQLKDALEWLDATATAGRNAWRIQEEARIEQNKNRAQEIVSKLGDPSRAKLAAAEKKGVIAAFLEGVSAFDISHYSFLQVLEYVLPEGISFLSELQKKARIADVKSQAFERAASDRLMAAMQPIVGNGSLAMSRAFWELKRTHDKEVQVLNGRVTKEEKISIDLAQKIIAGTASRGTLSSADILSLEAALLAIPISSRKTFVRFDRIVKAGTMEFVPMSKLDAIQYLLSWAQPDVRVKMEAEGWTESAIKQMEALTNDPVSQGARAFLRNEFDASFDKVNPIYRRQFGMNMPRGENYAPTKFRNAKDTVDISPFGGPLDTSGVTPGFAKARAPHSSMMRQTDALSVYWQHVAQQSHFIHYAELTRELRAILTAPDVRASMEQAHGKAILQQVDFWLNAIATKGETKASELLVDTQFLSNLIAAKSISSLGGSLRTIAMQVDAAMRFLFAMPPKRIFKALANLPEVIKTMPPAWNSESVQLRVVNGASPEARYLFERQRIRPSVMLRLGELSMMPMQYVDGFLTSFTAAIVYRDAHSQAKESGSSDAEADAIAADAMDDAVYRFAQPVGLTSRSLREVSGNRAIKIFMMFLSDARLKTALYFEAVRGLASGSGDGKRHIQQILAINAMAMVSHTVSNLYRDIFSDEPDEEIWNIEGYLKAALMAPMSGYFLAGAAWDVATSRLLGQHAFNTSQNPLVGSLEYGYRAVKNLDDIWNPDDPDAMLREWNAIARSMAVAGPASAVPAVVVNILKPIVGAIQNLSTDDEPENKD